MKNSPADGPKCDVCGHYHHQGVACTICGHKGLSAKHSRFRVRRPLLAHCCAARTHSVSLLPVVSHAHSPPPIPALSTASAQQVCMSSAAAPCTLHACFYDSSSTEQREWEKLHALVRIIRRRVFTEELKQAVTSAELVAATDAGARHVVAVVGHAPQGAARWRVIAAPFAHSASTAIASAAGPAASPASIAPLLCPGIAALDALGMAAGQRIAYLDRLCVLPRHRRQGVAAHVLQKIVVDVSTFATSGGLPISAIVAPCPQNAALDALFGALGFRPIGKPFAGVGGVATRLLALERS
jgi:GNAT superfamily N-acetyltransferase